MAGARPGRLGQDLAERVDVLEQALLARDAQVVDEGQVLRVLVEADAAAVGDDGDVEPGRWESVRGLGLVFRDLGCCVCVCV